MRKIVKEKEIKGLNTEIQLVQMEKFINEFDNAIKTNLRSRLKKLAIIMSPLILSLVGFLFFKNPLLLIIGTSITGVGGIVTVTSDFVKELKSINSDNDYNKSNTEKEIDVDQLLEDGIGKLKGEDFYSEQYKSTIAFDETEEARKYREALEKQQKILKNNPNIKIIDNDTHFLNKDETMVQVVKEIDAYTFAYNLPPLEISNIQWDLFFDTTYNFFEKNGIEKEFYDAMSQVGRFVFAKVLLNKKSDINIYDFIENLCCLDNEGVEKTEITSLQQEILSKLQLTKNVIYFSNNKSENGRKK